MDNHVDRDETKIVCYAMAGDKQNDFSIVETFFVRWETWEGTNFGFEWLFASDKAVSMLTNPILASMDNISDFEAYYGLGTWFDYACGCILFGIA